MSVPTNSLATNWSPLGGSTAWRSGVHSGAWRQTAVHSAQLLVARRAQVAALHEVHAKVDPLEKLKALRAAAAERAAQSAVAGKA